ncbi:UNVERIFIED_CONTAM: hypothetical protein GTU68_059755 [Idotea baltica]|nr:hypothetical protein [Idotea baltica]
MVVAINADESVRELKGEGRPLYTAADRAEILCALAAVDRVVVFSEKRATNAIETIRPHIYTKGGDYTAESLIDEERELMIRMGIEIQILSLVQGKSTSNTIKKMEAESPVSEKPRLALLGSGTGSNIRALIESIDNGTLDAEVGLILSDVESSGVLEIAREKNLTGIHIEPGSEKRGHLTDAALKEIVDRLKANRIDLVILAGFMRVVRESLLSEFSGRILNIHPSLLPDFPGLNAAKQAVEAGVSETGCTVHLVDATIDGGGILAQATVPVEAGDDAGSLQMRIQKVEHQLYAATIEKHWKTLQKSD